METRDHAQMGEALDRALRGTTLDLSFVWVKSNVPAWEARERHPRVAGMSTWRTIRAT